MEQDKIFFGEQGLSATSADFIANLAKEMLRKDESKMAGVNFVCEQVSPCDSPVKSEISIGMEEDEVRNIPSIMERIMRLKSLIAWLREAIKAKDRLLKEVENMWVGSGAWTQLGFEELPLSPEEECPMTEEEYLSTLSIADRNKMYKLQTKAAILSKILQKNGAFDAARERLSNIMAKPREVEKLGINNIVHYYEPSVDPDIVDEVYLRLSTEYKETQEELNVFLHAMDMALQQNKIEVKEKNRRSKEEYDQKEHLLSAQLSEWKSKETKRISNLKIIIPNSLRATYEEVQRVGK